MRISGAFCSSSCPALSACGLAETDTIQKRRRRRIILLRRVFHGMRSKNFLEQSEKRVRSRSPLLEVDGRWFHLLQTTHLPCESSLDEGSTRSHYNNMSAFTGQRTAKNTTVCVVFPVSRVSGVSVVCLVCVSGLCVVCCVLCFGVCVCVGLCVVCKKRNQSLSRSRLGQQVLPSITVACHRTVTTPAQWSFAVHALGLCGRGGIRCVVCSVTAWTLEPSHRAAVHHWQALGPCALLGFRGCASRRRTAPACLRCSRRRRPRSSRCRAPSVRPSTPLLECPRGCKSCCSRPRHSSSQHVQLPMSGSNSSSGKKRF